MIGWYITEERFVPEDLHHKETVFTLGNGYLGTRGSFEEGLLVSLLAEVVTQHLSSSAEQRG